MSRAFGLHAGDHDLGNRSGHSRSRIKSTTYRIGPYPIMRQDSIPSAGGSRPASVPRFPDIKDLQSRADAASKAFTVYTPIRTLLSQAKQAADQANADVSFKRPDRAYIEYLISSEILANLIPRHKDYPAMKADSRELGHLYRNLCELNKKQHVMAKEIYALIVDDNMQSGVRQHQRVSMPEMLPAPKDLQPPFNSTSNQAQKLNGHGVGRRADELFLETASDLRPSTGHPHSSSPLRSYHSSSVATSENPTSPLWSGRHQAHHSNPNRPPVVGDTLSDRFSQLRNSPTSEVPPRDHYERPYRKPRTELISPTEQSRYSSHDSSSSSPVSSRASVADFTSRSSISENQAMRLPPLSQPPYPPKIPLQSQQSPGLPMAPKPAYDPYRSVQPGANRVPVQNGGNVVNGVPRTVASDKTMSADLSKGPFITADELFDRMKKLNVLIIDVRTREEFDEGHIHANSILCVEPVILKSGISADELEERLIVSPVPELKMFESRNEYDMVVYYDQRTTSDSFLTGPPSNTDAYSLRTLHDALYEFNYYKPLRRPPLFLLGGVNAWVDVMGAHALAESRTAAQLGSTRSRTPVRRPGRPLGRVPMASSNSTIEVRKRRMREHHPLDAEEERKWLERSRNDELESPSYRQAQNDSDTDSRRQSTEEPVSPLVHTYEDFLRRFPDLGREQQSMMAARPPAPPPHKTPLNSVPNIPSRPAPAVPRPSYSGVSEREPLQVSPVSRAPASQPPLYTSRPITRYLKLPRTGLINFGVTCYMNATIQCLLATIPLSQFFLDDKWRDFCQKENWKGSKAVMPQIFASLIRSLWSGQFNAVRPSTLRGLSASLNHQWGEDRQQDAKEYLEFLLDMLHEDLNVNWDRSQLKPLTFEQEMKRERMDVAVASRIEWDRYSHRESSYITSLFAGQHASRLRCTTCRNTSTTYEPFTSISIEIPRSGKGDIHDCLRSYTQEEKLSRDEMWKCPYCNCEREATKQITLTRAPQVLVVHFKRFAMGKKETAKKVHTPINFPLTGLDIGKYMIPNRDHLSINGHTDEPSDPASTPPYTYDAFAVMRHLGQSGNGGHYIAVVRDAARGCWRKYDDDRVKDLDPNKLKGSDKLQNDQAYIVFYGRASAR